MSLAEFDYDLARKISKGEVRGEILTLSGEPVQIEMWEGEETSHPLRGWIGSEDRQYGMFGWTKEGKFYSTGMPHRYNLVLKIEDSKSWIEFDIETARLALAGETGRIVTRDGDPVEILEWENVNTPFSIYGTIHFRGERPAGNAHWTKEGKFHSVSGPDCGFDLFIEEIW